MSINSTAVVILEDVDGNKFCASMAQASTLAALESTRKGGIATVVGYKPSTGYTVKPLIDMQVITRFSTSKLYERRMLALDALSYHDVLPFMLEDEKLAAALKDDKLALISVFNTRKASEIESHAKTNSGDRSDAHRQAHDTFYGRIFDGVRVHYVTEKVDGETRLVLNGEGLPTVDAIMLSILELSRTVREAGAYKVVNSGIPVRVSDAIKKALNKRSVQYKALSLKPDNFEMLRVDGKKFLPEHVEKFGDILES